MNYDWVTGGFFYIFQTKENLILRARKVVVFKTSGVLRHRINGSRSF